MALITLIRHGQASFGADDYDCLSRKGEKQSRLLGNRFKQQREKADKVFVGDMLRHTQTAQHCLKAAAIKQPLHTLSGLNEFDHEQIITRFEPRYTDKKEMMIDFFKSENPNDTFTTMFKNALERWMCGQFDSDYDESWQAFQERVNKAFDEIMSHCQGEEHIWVFTSAGVISTVIKQLLRLEDEQTMRVNWALANTSITRVNKQEQYNEGLLLTLNDFSHFSHPYSNMVTWK